MTLILSGTNGLSDVDGSAATPAIRGTDTNTGMFFPAADTIAFSEGGVEVGRFDSSANFQFNSGYGSAATAYGCRAWVNFNGTGTVAIRASGNVSSITDSGTGAYTVNFTTALSDANYAGVIMTGTYQALASNDAAAPTTTAFAFISRQSNSPATSLDSPYLHVAIFR
jgi:hypothetical protein